MTGHDDTVLFGERLLRVIDEGRRVATYKLALLLAMLDALAAGADNSGAPPSHLHTRVIARQVLRLYLPQVSPFPTAGGTVALRQITGSGSQMFRSLSGLHDQARRHGCLNPIDLPRCLPDAYSRTLDSVERTFARYPIRLLQVVDGHDLPFMYDIDWGTGVTLRQLHAPDGGLVRFRPGAADALLRLGPLVRPLIETHWTRMVASINAIDLDEQRLRTHLFGASRRAFPRQVRSGLAELQHGVCLYCDQPLPKSFEVDHFIPWSRHPNDAVENLVATDRRCNGAKRDALPAVKLVDRWSENLDRHGDSLRSLADGAGWPSDVDHTVAVVRSTYRHLPAGTALWAGVGQIELFAHDSSG